MTGTVASFGYGGVSLQQTLNLTSLSQKKDSLQTQASTGVRSDSYAGLGTARTQALALQPAITQVTAWSSNITTVQNRLTTTQSVLSQISTIAGDLNETLSTLAGSVSSSTIGTAAQQAKTALTSLGNLLNTQQGDSYIFSGLQSSEAPVSGDPGNSDLASSIADAVKQMGTDGASSVLSSTLTLAGTTSDNQPFSAALSTDPATASAQNLQIVTGKNETATAGIVATQGGASSEGSTGSPIRDLMRNLMVVASLGSADPGDADYTQLIQGLQDTNTAAIDGLSDMSGALGVQQNTLTSQSAMLEQMKSALTTQLGTTKNADLAQVSVQLNDTSNQLQASYSIIADMKGMTLASYL
ncbi:flagellin [Gluconobacter thailandicus]|uniref:Flagellin n=1 Tax=Gluconobacter thailandicus TaxID=257438 RepID=A0AAP9ERA4_GLUTH|nr:flagellin [Gluconobacter thailandicus]QEH95789.1 flagellin [Gluconobacter thailandicus]